MLSRTMEQTHRVCKAAEQDSRLRVTQKLHRPAVLPALGLCIGKYLVI